MSFLDAGGVSKWSQVTIDADKDMLGFGLSDLKELALGMNVGDMLAFNNDTGKLGIIRINPVIGTELLTKGTVSPPVWGFPDSGETGIAINSTIAAGVDDADFNGTVYENNGNAGGSGIDNSSHLLMSAWRFQGINIPAAAIIMSAQIMFVAVGTRAAQNVFSVVYGEKAAIPAVYGASENFTLRAKTNAYSMWNGTGLANWTALGIYSSPNLVSIVQELVYAYGPYVNGVMAFQWLNAGGLPNNFQTAYTYDNNPAYAAMLSITYGQAL
jgi:hypothetical protein